MGQWLELHPSTAGPRFDLWLPLEKETAPHSSTLAWRIPWTEEPGRLQSMGSQRVRNDWATSLHFAELRSHKLIAVVKKKEKEKKKEFIINTQIPILPLNMQNIFNFMMIGNLVMNIFVPKYFSKLFHHGAFPHDREWKHPKGKWEWVFQEVGWWGDPLGGGQKCQSSQRSRACVHFCLLCAYTIAVSDYILFALAWFYLAIGQSLHCPEYYCVHW